MGKMLENLRWRPRWTSHLGCVKGCLDYLGLEVSDAWLYGATGHAFILNMHEVVCPSGPTAWHTEMLFKLGRNLGYDIEGMLGWRRQGDFAERQALAWERTREAIDAGLPCYGWELDIPEFYVVYGYDDTGYYFSGPRCDAGSGPKPWQELGASEIGLIEMYSLRPDSPADDAQIVREALSFALEHAQSPAKWTYPKYAAGLAGYDHWVQALEGGYAHPHGMAYNAAVWSECRGFAVRFLQEAAERLDPRLGPLFDEALLHYHAIAQGLSQASRLFPFPPRGGEVEDAARREAAVEHLRAAQRAEAKGLKALKAIAEVL